MSISEEMRQVDMIEQIREDIKNVSYPQSFCPTLYPSTNCMAYAIGAKVPDVKRNFYFPGGISSKANDFHSSEIVENFIKDMEVIGRRAEVISLEQAKEATQDGIQTMALFYSHIDNDFHCIRKDKEGGWSHKAGYKAAPIKLKYNYERFLYFEESDLSYDLVAFFNLSFL